jgi:hypothetical protein
VYAPPLTIHPNTIVALRDKLGLLDESEHADLIKLIYPVSSPFLTLHKLTLS